MLAAADCDNGRVSTLRDSLSYEPRELKFGTSGRRGEVVHLTQLEIYVNVRGEIEYLLSLPRDEGGIRGGDPFPFGYDLRPSSTMFATEHAGRGEICQAVERAIGDAGMRPICLGCVPTPAVMAYAAGRGLGSIMVTGSHIPFDRNGYKLNTSRGELLKHQEGPVNESVARVRAEIYAQPADASLFDATGMFRSGHRDLPTAIPDAREAYLRRYSEFFPAGCLEGTRVLLYEHSAVGRELLAELLRILGAEVFPAGRSETFVPIDTENMDAAQLARIERLAREATVAHGRFDVVVSTDGDSDRPLLCGVDAEGSVRFFSGDLVGMIVASYLGADAVVVPITCNDGIDRGSLAQAVEPKTRIGSPYVIAGMEAARARGRRAVCGWEANGGFLTGSEFKRGDRSLAALPTRDAFLPVVCVLSAARERGLPVSGLFAELPQRFSRAALLPRFPRAAALAIMDRFIPGRDAGRTSAEITRELAAVFSPGSGFGRIEGIDYTDGVRVHFSNEDVVHFRPSGNADEFRIYGYAGSQQRADEIVAAGIAPDGFLRQLEAALREGFPA